MTNGLQDAGNMPVLVAIKQPLPVPVSPGLPGTVGTWTIWAVERVGLPTLFVIAMFWFLVRPMMNELIDANKATREATKAQKEATAVQEKLSSDINLYLRPVEVAKVAP